MRSLELSRRLARRTSECDALRSQREALDLAQSLRSDFRVDTPLNREFHVALDQFMVALYVHLGETGCREKH
jgi:hypothetical protein